MTEPAFQLSAMTGLPRRSRTLVLVVAGLAVLVVVLGVTVAVLLTQEPGGQAAAESQPSPPAAPEPTASQLALWQNGCIEVGRDIDEGIALDPIRISLLAAQAKEAPTFDIRFAAQQLIDAAELASAASGASDAAKQHAGMRDAAGSLRKACMAAGYPQS